MSAATMTGLPSRPLRAIAYGLWAAVLLAYLAYALIFGIYAAALFRFPFDYDQGEGFELLDAIYFARGQWPYRDIESYPFYASNYPPLFHLLAVPLVWIFGPRLIAGRLLSTAATLALAAAVGLAVRRWTGRWALAGWAGGMVLASNYVYHIGPLSRSHMMMVLFETLAVLALARADGFPDRRALIWGSLALMAAGWTKQHALITVLAVLAYLFPAGSASGDGVGPGIRGGQSGPLLPGQLGDAGLLVVAHHRGQHQRV
jgi:hypothetical protein